MKQYLNFLNHIKNYGTKKNDRTNIGTTNIFGYQMRFNLSNGFPLLTTKKLHVQSIIHELLWFLAGNTNSKALEKNGINIWKKWALKDGSLGPIYGQQWRHWKTQDGSFVDQIKQLIFLVKNNQTSRRMVVSSWNPEVLPDESISPQDNVRAGKAALAACHTMFQLSVTNNKLSCMVTQRSADVFLGVPFNIASYALLTHMIAQQCKLSVGELIWSGGDCHIYDNHWKQVNQQIQRNPRDLPLIKIKKQPPSIFHYQFDDFEIINYNPYPPIKAEVAV